MNEEQIRGLLQSADQAAGPPVFARLSAREIRRRIRRRRLLWAGPALAAAALVVLGLALWNVRLQPDKVAAPPEQNKLASLETQVKQLQAQTQATLELVQDVLARERQTQRLDALEAELASIPDPVEELQKQTDRTAFTLLYQADRLYRELNQTESAVEAYQRVIQLFPRNRWADVARARLVEIRKPRINKSKTEGDPKCGSQSV